MKSAPPRKGIRSHCLFPMARAATYGIIEVHPSATCSRCPDAKVACGFEGIGKVGRQSRFGQNLPQTGLSVFSPKTLHCQPHAFEASGNGNKRLAGNQKKYRNGLQTKINIDASSVSRSFSFIEVLLLPQT